MPRGQDRGKGPLRYGWIDISPDAVLTWLVDEIKYASDAQELATVIAYMQGPLA